jgi:hypothetical protein
MYNLAVLKSGVSYANQQFVVKITGA